MSQDLVAAQPHLSIVQGPSPTTVTFLHAASFFSRLLYDFVDVASPAPLCRVRVTHKGTRFKMMVDVSFVDVAMYAFPSRLGRNYSDRYNSSLTLSPPPSSPFRLFPLSSGGVSRVPAAALARILESAAAISDCKRPSLDNRWANFAISPSYSSHSGICRARASFGSFCENQNVMVKMCRAYNRLKTHRQWVLTQVDCFSAV